MQALALTPPHSVTILVKPSGSKSPLGAYAPTFIKMLPTHTGSSSPLEGERAKMFCSVVKTFSRGGSET
jgi:hypothetical protein